MTTEANKEDMQTFQETLAPTVRRNMEVIDAAESRYKQQLHISMDRDIKVFIPVIGKRQGNTEDRTVPRVCVAPTLMDCFYGYSAALDNFLYNKSDGKEHNEYFRGGWKIYGFDYDLCIKPNRNLVYDAEASNEHWLVSFNKESAQYKPRDMGKVFFYSLKLVARTKERPEQIVEFFLEISAKEGLFVTASKHLEKGYYKIVGHWTEQNELDFQAISKEEYEAAKKVSASLLSAPVDVPASMNW